MTCATIKFNNRTRENLATVTRQMSLIQFLLMRTIAIGSLLLLLSACSLTPYKYDEAPSLSVIDRAVIQQQGHFTVRASVPGIEEANAIFGIPLEKRGIQPVWLEITNHGSARARVAPYSLDDEYFPPHEVAYMYRKQFSKEGWLDMEKRFYEMSLPRQIAGGATVSGYVFTHLQPGTKAFNVDIFYVSDELTDEHFTFFVEVPGFTPDHAEIDFQSLYSAEEIRDVYEAELRSLVEAIPCCTTNRAGDGQGRPVNLFMVAGGKDLLQALLRAEWMETSYERNEEYLSATGYLYGRPADAVFRKRRGKSSDRNEMSLWLTPLLHEGTPVWAAQVRHAIGRFFAIGEKFLGVQLDPDVNEGRNYFLQNIWYSQSLESYAWSVSGIVVPQERPLTDFGGNEFFSDGLRMVLWIAGDTISLQNATNRRWDSVDEVPNR